MWFRWWRMAGVAATGAAAAAALFAGYREARKAISLPAEPLHALEALCVAGVLGAGVALLAVEWTRRAYRRLLTRLASRVAELRHNPAPHGLHELDRLLPPHPEAAAVQEQVEALTSCYRTAVARVVQAQERLEELRRPAAKSRGARTTVPVSCPPSRRRQLASHVGSPHAEPALEDHLISVAAMARMLPRRSRRPAVSRSGPLR